MGDGVGVWGFKVSNCFLKMMKTNMDFWKQGEVL